MKGVREEERNMLALSSCAFAREQEEAARIGWSNSMYFECMIPSRHVGGADPAARVTSYGIAGMSGKAERT
jgi:hypothetical protein